MRTMVPGKHNLSTLTRIHHPGRIPNPGITRAPSSTRVHIGISRHLLHKAQTDTIKTNITVNYWR